MGFLTEHFGQDYSATPRAELAQLKDENERLALAAEGANQPLLDNLPSWLNMTNTTKCNLQCIMCNQAYGKIASWVMTPPIYEKIVTELYPFVKTVQLTSIGEPLMTPHLPRVIDDLYRYGVGLQIVTNGTLMRGDELLAKLADIGEYITLSLDGATAETYDGIRQGAKFTEVIANLKRFNYFCDQLPPARRPFLEFNYILMRRNLQEAPDFVDLAADLGGNKIVFRHLVLFVEGLEEEMLEHHPTLCNEYLERIAARGRERGIEVEIPPPFPETTQTKQPEPDPAPPPAHEPEPTAAPIHPEPETTGDEPYLGERCTFLWRRVYIGPNGEIGPCCLAGIEPLGNLQESTFPQIWNGPAYRALRENVHTNHPVPPCNACYLINRSPKDTDFRRLED